MTDALFEAFVLKHQDMVFATAVRLLANRAEAEDVAQTVFLRAFERFDRIGPSPAAAGWLKTVTTNLCLTHLSRHRSRWRLFSEIARADGSAPADDQAWSAPESQSGDVEAADTRERLERALRRLPPDQRVPIVLFHFEEKSYQEIATLLGRSLAKIKTDIHRGRTALRRELEGGHGA
jgi:RNA polymerase sigma-70 factor (ECF subfamily)